MEEIESRAEAVLARLPDYIWDGDRPPIPIEEIADSHFGLRVRDVAPAEMRAAPGCPELADDVTLSGLLIPSLGEIWVNREEASLWPGRRRFTIAHEIGHHVLHRSGGQPLFCRTSAVDPEPGAGAGAAVASRSTEREANAFAAAILMPAWLLEQHYRYAEGDFDRLCEAFRSSGAAMGRRLRAVIPPGGSR